MGGFDGGTEADLYLRQTHQRMEKDDWERRWPTVHSTLYTPYSTRDARRSHPIIPHYYRPQLHLQAPHNDGPTYPPTYLIDIIRSPSSYSHPSIHANERRDSTVRWLSRDLPSADRTRPRGHMAVCLVAVGGRSLTYTDLGCWRANWHTGGVAGRGGSALGLDW